MKVQNLPLRVQSPHREASRQSGAKRLWRYSN
jgi:hypothetical protein